MMGACVVRAETTLGWSHMIFVYSNRVEFFVTEIGFLCLTCRLAALSETWENSSFPIFVYITQGS